MHYATMHWLPLTPEDSEDPLGLIHSITDLTLDFAPTNPSAWVPPFSPVHRLPSFDPMSPSYEPFAASPCNPFPTTSPFASFTFSRPKLNSRLRLDDSYTSEATDPCPTPLSHPISQTPSRPLSRTAALSLIPPPHSAPSLRRTKPCRFYLDPAGCKSGRWCNFKHPLGARSEDRLYNEDSTLDELRAAVVHSRIANNANSGDINAWEDVPDVRDIDPNWGKKGEDDVHPKWRSEFRSITLLIKLHLILMQLNHVETFFLVYAAMATNASSYTPRACSRQPHPIRIPVLFLFQLPWRCP